MESDAKIRKSGFSLVEIIVSISLFLLIMSAVLAVVNRSFNQRIHATNIIKSTIIAEETLEILKNIKDEEFSNINNGNYGLSNSSGYWELSPTPDEIDIFTREIIIGDLNDGQKSITVDITWSDTVGSDNSFSAETYLADWRGITEEEPET